MMKRTINVIIAIIVSVALIQMDLPQQSYTINADIKGQKQYGLLLRYKTAIGWQTDSPQVMGSDKFCFTGEVSEPRIASLVSNHPSSIPDFKKEVVFIPPPALDFVLCNEKITITGTSSEIFLSSVKGGPLNDEMDLLKTRENPLVKEILKLSKQFNATPGTDIAAREQIAKTIRLLREEHLNIQKNFIRHYPQSFVSMYLLSELQYAYDTATYENVYKAMPETYKNSFYGKIVAANIESVKATELGRTAIEFTKKDFNGKDFSLTSLKGQYVLLDFWGSWCEPCRQSHPHLKKVYEQYQPKGLEIVGIADEKKSKLVLSELSWKKAVNEDGINNWVNVLNDAGKDTLNLVQRYGINGFPTKFLLDKEGRIIYKLVGGGEEGNRLLDEKLEEIFKD